MWMFVGDAVASTALSGGADAAYEVLTRDDGSDERLIFGEGALPAGAEDATIKFTGGNFGTAAGEFLFRVGMWTPAEDRDDFLAWYEIDHLPLLLEHPTWDGCRFIEVAAADGFQFYVLHQMQDPEALNSEARAKSRDTPWFHRLKAKEWFDEGFTRALYRRIAA